MYGKREREKKPDEHLLSGGCPSGSKKVLVRGDCLN